MKKLSMLVAATLFSTAAAIVMATEAHAEIDTYIISTRGRVTTIERLRTDTGKPLAPKVYTYYRDAKGNLYDPVTGWPKGRNY